MPPHAVPPAGPHYGYQKPKDEADACSPQCRTIRRGIYGSGGDDGGGDDGGGLKRTVGVQGAVPAFGYMGNAGFRRQAL